MPDGPFAPAARFAGPEKCACIAKTGDPGD